MKSWMLSFVLSLGLSSQAFAGGTGGGGELPEAFKVFDIFKNWQNGEFVRTVEFNNSQVQFQYGSLSKDGTLNWQDVRADISEIDPRVFEGLKSSIDSGDWTPLKVEN